MPRANPYLRSAYPGDSSIIEWLDDMYSSELMERETVTSLDLHLDEMLSDSESARFGSRTQDRRKKARINEPFLARIWKVDSGTLPFKMEAVLANISATGLYVKSLKAFDTGSEVRLLVQLFSGQTSGVTASIQGRILRSELHADGKYGLAVAISKSRFL